MDAVIRDTEQTDAFPFLRLAGARDPGRLVLFLVLGVLAAGVAGLLAGLAITLGFAVARAGGNPRAVADALDSLTRNAASGRPLLSYSYELTVAGVASIAAAWAALAVASGIFGRPIRSFLTAAPRFRWRVVGAGFAVGFPLVAVAFLAERAFAPSPLAAPILTPGAGVGARAAYALIAAACLYLAAFAEEALFRGWLLQQTAAWTRNLIVILAVNGALFSLAHFDPNPANLLLRAVMGAGWAWIALRTAGVEFTTGAHLANNLFIALFVMPVSFAPAKSGPFDIRPALVELATVLILAGVVELRLRRGATKADPARA